MNTKTDWTGLSRNCRDLLHFEPADCNLHAARLLAVVRSSLVYKSQIHTISRNQLPLWLLFSFFVQHQHLIHAIVVKVIWHKANTPKIIQLGRTSKQSQLSVTPTNALPTERPHQNRQSGTLVVIQPEFLTHAANLFIKPIRRQLISVLTKPSRRTVVDKRNHGKNSRASVEKG